MKSTTASGISRRRFSGLVAGVAALGAPSLRAQSGNRIVLGQSAAFTGAAAQLGIQFHAGAKLFFDQLNGQGGVNNQRVEILQLDDGYEPDRCAENTNKLISADVFALFGYIGTPTSVAALPLAIKAEMPFFAPFTGAMGLREPFNRLAFHLRASYNDETALIVRQLTNLGLKKIAVFHQNDAYGKAGLDGTVLALKSRNLKPVATATVERNSVDVAQAVETINAAKPDAVVQISAYKSCAAYIRAAQGRRLRRHLLQRVLRGHAGAGRRAGQGRRRCGGVAGHAHALHARPSRSTREFQSKPCQGRQQGAGQLLQHGGFPGRPAVRRRPAPRRLAHHARQPDRGLESIGTSRSAASRCR